jgi:RNA polymerase sigma-70 factor, ECF subfamily
LDVSYLKYLAQGQDKNEILRGLMTAYGDDVWNFAFSLTRRRDIADDVMQDVFVKAFNKLDSFRAESSAKTWLLSIARNTVKDHRKSAFIRKVTLVEYITDKGTHASAESEYFEHELLSSAWEAVMKLPVKLREVMVLFAHHQLSISEIAALLRISEAATKVRLHRARLKVNQICDESEGDYNGRR